MKQAQYLELMSLSPGTAIYSVDNNLYIKIDDPDDRLHFVRLSDGALIHTSCIPTLWKCVIIKTVKIKDKESHQVDIMGGYRLGVFKREEQS